MVPSTPSHGEKNMQLLLGHCPRCNHRVGRVRGQFYCLRCHAFPLDPGKTAPGTYRDEEFPDSVFWSAGRIYAFLHLRNRFDEEETEGPR